MSVGPTEILLIALVVFLLFGTRRLADLGKGLGEGIRNLKRGLAGDEEAVPTEKKKDEPPKQLTGRVVTLEQPESAKPEPAVDSATKTDDTKPEALKQSDPADK